MEEPTDANEKLKLKPTLEKITKVVKGGSEITKKEYTEWGKTLKKIVEGKV